MLNMKVLLGDVDSGRANMRTGGHEQGAIVSPGEYIL